VARSGGDAASAGLFGLMVLAWGGNYLFVRVGEESAAPLWLAGLRASVGAAGVGAYLALRARPRDFSGRDARDALLLGIPNTAVFLGLWFVAAPAVAPGEAAVLIYTFPLWVALLAPAVLGRPLTQRHGIAVALGFAGVVLVSEPWAGGATRGLLVPFAELLAAAISWAAATVVFQRRFRPEHLPLANGYQLAAGAIVLVAIAGTFGEASAPLAATGLWISVAWLGLFGTAFAYVVWFHLLRTVHAASLSAYSFLVPLVALALSAVFTGERVDPAQAVGVALVLVGIYLVGTHRRDRSAGRLPAAGGG
jgi:drug/metabolite transporter (DMT)-like permease